MPLINLKQTLFGVCASLGSRGLSKGAGAACTKGLKRVRGAPVVAGCTDLPLAWMLAHPCSASGSRGGGSTAKVGSQSHLIVPRALWATNLYVHSFFLAAKTRALVSLVRGSQDTMV